MEADELLIKEVETKERLAEVVISIYSQSHSLLEFEQTLKETLAQSGNVAIEEIDSYILGSYMYPPSLKKTDTHSPIESIWATLENLKIVSELEEVGRDTVHGMILSGSMSREPFSGVRGKTPPALVALGAQERDFHSFSDIDMLMSFENFSAIKKGISDFVKAGILKEDENKRVELFEHFYKEGKADILSIRAHYKGVEESFHVLLNKTVESIAQAREKYHYNGIGYVRDFRPNIPRSLEKKGYYLAFDLIGGEEVRFPIHLEEVKDPNDNRVAGYITHIPTGGVLHNGNEDRYLIGILSYFLLVAPVVLVDKDSFISSNIESLQKKVRSTLNGRMPLLLPYQQRMSKTTLERLKASFV